MERSFVPLLRYFSGFAVLCLVINRAFSADAPLDLSMEKAMDMAESYSFTARIAQQTQDSNESQENVQLRSMLPNVTASGTYLTYSTSVNPAVGTPAGGLIGIPNSIISSAGATLTQHIVGLIPLYLSLEQAAAQTRSALQNKELSQINARFLGASSFVNAQKADELLKVAKSSVEVAEKQLYDAQAQFDAGKLINADVLKFKLNLENAKTVLIQAQTTYKVSFVTLAETIGVKETENIVLPQKHVSIFNQNKIKSDLPTALEAAHTQRRDILAAKENITAANYGKKVAISSYLPTFDFIANYTRDFQAQTISYGGTTYAPNQIQDNFYYGVQFTWNLLDWGVRQAQISAAASAEHSAKISMEQVESQTRVDVTNSYLQLQSAIQVLDSSKISVQYADDVYSQFKAQFNNGQITTTDLIAAYNDQTSARANFANAMGDLDLAVLSLQKAMGQRLTTLN